LSYGEGEKGREKRLTQRRRGAKREEGKREKREWRVLREKRE
jgi:hypothetical protein